MAVVSSWRRIGQKIARAAIDAGVREVTKRLQQRGSGASHSDDDHSSTRRSPSSTHDARPERDTSTQQRSSSKPKPRPRRSPEPQRSSREPDGGYLGDFHGVPDAEYAPDLDGDPDPGEVVWAWVPYEEDHSRGKDRPVVVIARHGRNYLALALTSKDHDRDAAQELRAGRHWMDIGTGDWDRKRRPSEVRLNRVLQLRPRDVRREGAILDRDVFHDIIKQARKTNGWS